MKRVAGGVGLGAAVAMSLGLCAGGGSVLAAGPDTLAGQVAPLAAQSGASLGVSPEQRLREELRAILLDMIESGAFGQTPPDQIALSVDAPAERTSGLGVLVDSSSGARAADGLHVLGTTPGSAAGRMGLRGGDVIVSVNGVALAGLGDDANGRARAAELLRDQVSDLADGADLKFEVLRDGRTMAVSGIMASAWVPAMHLTIGDGVAVAAAGNRAGRDGSATSACGRVNIFDVAPRQQDLHGAVLISIDGERSPFAGQTAFRLSVGRHVLKIGERIDHRYLGFNDRLRNSDPDGRYKTLSVDVAADTTYLIAARLNKDKLNEWRDGAYWEPVVWKETREACH